MPVERAVGGCNPFIHKGIHLVTLRRRQEVWRLGTSGDKSALRVAVGESDFLAFYEEDGDAVHDSVGMPPVAGKLVRRFP